MRLYKYNSDGKPIYRIGNNIILKKQIGTDSTYGVIYLSSFRDKINKIYKFAIKLMLVDKYNKLEIEILKILKNSVIKGECPHFPILYANLVCRKFYNLKRRSSYKKSESNSSIEENIINYPEIIRRNYKNGKFYFMLNELANGDLKTFINKYYNDNNLIQNALVQIYLSLLFFYKTTLHWHNDAHSGNFLYHKVKPGGYFYYNILGIDYFLENLGFLWVIWDFGFVTKFETNAKKQNKYKHINNDLTRIIKAFENEKINNIIYDLYDKNNTIGYTCYSNDNMNNLIFFILKTFTNYDFIKTSIKDKTKIINKIPYTIKT